MKRSRFLTLSALYIATHSAMAEDATQRAADDVTQATVANSESATSSMASEFAELAGSEENAQKLIASLRGAKPVTLPTALSAEHEIKFVPPKRPLSVSDIHKALSLAQAQLRSKNILSPAPEHLRAALAGGELPNSEGEMTHVIGILPLHQRGMNWEQIARALHVSLPKGADRKS